MIRLALDDQVAAGRIPCVNLHANAEATGLARRPGVRATAHLTFARALEDLDAETLQAALGIAGHHVDARLVTPTILELAADDPAVLTLAVEWFRSGAWRRTRGAR